MVLFGILFILLPFMNFFTVAWHYHIPVHASGMFFRLLNVYQLILFFASIPVGIGLLMVKKWGWWAFLGYSATLVTYNIYSLINYPVAYNAQSLIEALIIIVSVAYFTHKDISAPYMKLYPRGWRLQRRSPVVLNVQIDDKNFSTRDAGLFGIYVSCSSPVFFTGQRVSVRFNVPDGTMDLTGGVVRVDDEGVGIAFRGITRTQKRIMRTLIRDHK